MYLLKLSLRPWRLAPWSQLFSGMAVGFLLLLVGFLFWMQQGLKTVLVRLKGEQVITAYLQPSVDSQDEGKLVDSIRVQLGSQSTSDLELIDHAEFLKRLKGQHPDLERELEDLGPEERQLVPRYVSISGILPSSALEKIKSLPGVESAESSGDRYHHIVGAFSALRWVARVLMLGICLALLTGLIHLSRMNCYLHKEAMKLLRFWGAGSAVMAVPGMISGLTVGLLGGVIAAVGWMTLGFWLIVRVRALSSILKEMPAVSPQLTITLFASGLLIGLIAGALGSLSGPQLRQDGDFGP